MIIDSLTHITPDGRWFNTSHDASVERLLREMDKACIDKAVVVALAGYIENSFVTKICRQHSDRLIPGASLDPSGYSSSKEVVKAVKDILCNGEFAVLKLHPGLNGYDPLDKRCLSALEEIASFSEPIPIWLDTLFRSPKYLLQKSPVDTIQELSFRFKNLQFVLLHSLGSQILQLAEITRLFQNLTLDLSLTMLYYTFSSVQEDIKFVLLKRDLVTIAGSDFPEFTPIEYLQKFSEYATQIKLSEEKYKNIIGNNLINLLGDFIND